MNTHYATLGLTPDADAAAIEAAYQQQRERYSPARVAELDESFAHIARERLAVIEQAYRVLSDPERRAAYDQENRSEHKVAPKRSGLSRREVLMLVAGAIVGLVIIVAVWNVAGNSTTPSVGLARLERPAPAFTLPSIDGQNLRLEDYIGKKTVLVNFWYSNCAPCQEETPALQQVYEKLAPEGLVVIGVNVRGNERNGVDGDNDIRAFLKRYNITYPIAIDEKGDIGRAYQVLPLPSSYFIDTSGTIRYAAYQTVTAEDVERVFQELQRGATAMR